MLTQLYIQNVAVIQKATIDFTRGFNVFTGETGAGKTILISAIDAVMGERTSKEIIRTGEEKAFVSALFEDISARSLEKLRELGFEDDDGSVLITREITAAGKSSCKIGGMPATAAIMKEISSLLIHIHGQRDSTQMLLSENHMDLLDLFGSVEAELLEYRGEFGKMREIQSKLDAISLDETQKAQRIDMLTYQIKEIEDARLSDEDEEEQLTARKKIIRNSEKIMDGLAAAHAALAGGDEERGIESLFGDLTDGVATASRYIEPLEPTSGRLAEIGYELQEISREIRSYLDDFDFDPRELDQIESRLDTIYKLKRKYGSTIAEIIAFGEKAGVELESVAMSGERAQKLEAELQVVRGEALRLGKKLSTKRLNASEEFARLVEDELQFLDMPAVKLSISHREIPMNQNGVDEMELLIVTNVGEAPKPLSKIASGGEIARIMLAVKNVLAGRDDIDTLIFDEVDTGVSGRAAQKIGRKLKQVAQSRQVICVTHLAQVAAFADNHMLINKEVDDGKTYTRVKNLEKQQAIEELARITSGDLITDLSLNSARELWEHSQNNWKNIT